MIDAKLKAKIRLHYESHNDTAKEVAAHFDINYRTLMVWVQKEKWEKGRLIENVLQKDIKNDLLKKEFGSRLHLESEKIKNNIERNIDDLRHFNSLSVDEFNLEIEKISDEILSSALSAEFIHKNMIESFLYAKHELKRMAILRKENQASPALIAMSEKLINMLANIQKSLYSKDILERALNSDTSNIDLQKISEAELKKLASEVIDTDTI